MNNLKRPLVFVLSLFLPFLVFSQCPSPIPVGDVVIRTQQDLTTYTATRASCTEIIGNLIIDDSSDVNNGNYSVDITSLSAFNSLTDISGSLNVIHCTLLENMSGLDHLTSIGADMWIRENDHQNFTDFTGLGSLTHVGNKITVRLNDNLQNFNGMGILNGSLAHEIKITDNPVLTSISQLSGITDVAGDVTIKRNNLTNLSGLDGLTTIGGFLNVREEPSLNSIAQLTNLTSVGSNSAGSVLLIWKNPLLISLLGLDNVTSVSGQLSIFDNGDLGDCDAVCYLVSNEATATGGLAFSTNEANTPCAYNDAMRTHCATILPISLLTFDSKVRGHLVALNWETESEINNAGFYIEKSINGRDWQEIGWVEGHGTTSKEEYYDLIDESPSVGSNYYRLKQVDFDRSFSYSHVVSAYLKDYTTDAITLHPNPVQDILFVQTSSTEKIELIIFDGFGKQVLVAKDVATGVDLTSLPNGIYSVRTTILGQESNWQKLVKF